MQKNEEMFEINEESEAIAIQIILHTVKELANECKTIEEFRDALSRVIVQK